MTLMKLLEKWRQKVDEFNSHEAAGYLAPIVSQLHQLAESWEDTAFDTVHSETYCSAHAKCAHQLEAIVGKKES